MWSATCVRVASTLRARLSVTVAIRVRLYGSTAAYYSRARSVLRMMPRFVMPCHRCMLGTPDVDACRERIPLEPS